MFNPINEYCLVYRGESPCNDRCHTRKNPPYMKQFIFDFQLTQPGWEEGKSNFLEEDNLDKRVYYDKKDN